MTSRKATLVVRDKRTAQRDDQTSEREMQAHAGHAAASALRSGGQFLCVDRTLLAWEVVRAVDQAYRVVHTFICERDPTSTWLIGRCT